MHETAAPSARSVAAHLGLQDTVIDPDVQAKAVAWLREHAISLPTFAELTDPQKVEARAREYAAVDPDAADPANLFRVHWFNGPDRRNPVAVPEHVVLDPAFTGVDAPIVVLLGDRFPMIGAHKVLAAYACLAPRLVTGTFDPGYHRAVWPSTGNYARGGVAISRIMGCRGVAVLPEGMSRERFDWLSRWVADPDDIIATPGSESNVKEIYDACAELAEDPRNVVLNQFCEFANHLAHFQVTGTAFGRVVDTLIAENPTMRPAAFVAASGSAGTLGAGDWLKERYGTRTVAVEALECPTMLYNGYGEHNIQGIGDKHIPLIHNVTNTDVVVAVSDQATDELGVVCNADAGRRHLAARGVSPALLEALPSFGLSSHCNVVAAVKTARKLALGPDDLVLTVATDSAGLYLSERARVLAKRFGGELDEREAEAVHNQHLLDAEPDHVLVLGEDDRNRIFNLGYFTWVEQQGVPLPVFESRRDQSFWRELRDLLPNWDDLIADVNQRIAASS